jgi:flagellar basal-body rod protein FlgG
MLRGIYSSAAGMLSQQAALDVTANNLANVNTAGFKADGTVFSAVLRDMMSQGATGTTAVQTFTDFSSGALQHTGSPLDVAILGEGYFTVNTPQGVRYTRDGSFHVDQNGILSASDGCPILSVVNKPINIGTVKPVIHSDGTITAKDNIIGKLGIVNSTNMRKVGENHFEGSVTPAKDVNLTTGGIESANISVVNAMVSMISIMRAFEANQRVLTTQDETLGRAVNDLARL